MPDNSNPSGLAADRQELTCKNYTPAFKALASYSRPAAPYDNTQAGVGWRTLKMELLSRGGAFASLEEVRLAVAHYLDTYCNRDCHHSALGYRSPHRVDRDFQISLL